MKVLNSSNTIVKKSIVDFRTALNEEKTMIITPAEIWVEDAVAKSGNIYQRVCIDFTRDKSTKVENYGTAVFSDVGRKIIKMVNIGEKFDVRFKYTDRGFNDWIDIKSVQNLPILDTAA